MRSEAQTHPAGGRLCAEFLVIHVSAERTRDGRAAPAPVRRWPGGDNPEERVERDLALPQHNADVALPVDPRMDGFVFSDFVGQRPQ